METLHGPHARAMKLASDWQEKIVQVVFQLSTQSCYHLQKKKKQKKTNFIQRASLIAQAQVWIN